MEQVTELPDNTPTIIGIENQPEWFASLTVSQQEEVIARIQQVIDELTVA